MTDTVTVTTNPSTNTVEIVSVGPQGPQGPQGVKGDVGDVNPDMITLRDAAAASASAAAGSASSASTSATTATTQASSASGSASTATSQATIATNQATTATTKAGEASTSATNAAASAGTASSSATTATTQATNATNSASSAAGSASTATAQAAIATTKAAEADASATAAAGSASSASTSASTASTQATNAANSASTATSAAATATTQATNASTSATTATTKANDAANSAASVGAAAATASTQAGLAIVSANSAAASASSVGTAAATATAKASEAAASAAAINATFGNAASVALQAQNAQSAASLAQGYAASASSVVQQDLSGVTVQALHRSPNAITAQFIYDTSKDSDGGAWTEKCQQTSWYNEALAGKWLGPQFTETFARYSGATVSTTELITNGNFSNGTTGWTASTYGSSTISANNNVLRVTETGAASNAAAGQTFPVTSGKVYRVTFDVVSNTSSQGIGCWIGTSYGAANWLYSNVTYGYSHPGRSTFYFTAAGATAYFNLVGYFTAGGTSEYFEVANISVREVTALNTASNDYFQLTTDGKFYRLYKNLLKASGDVTNSLWIKGNATILSGQTALDGSATAFKLVENTANNSHDLQQGGAVCVTNTFYASTVYAKASGRTKFRIQIQNNGGNATQWEFDLTAVTVLNTYANWTGHGATITDVGSGWYRCTLYGQSPTTGTSIAYVLQLSNGNNSYTGDGTSGVLFWRPQLELSNAFTSYEETPASSEIFRGNKGDFPRLAAIVAEAGNVNIYDLTEPGRPMWMRFNGGTGSVVAYGTVINSVAALNGEMIVGSAASQGLSRISFFEKDYMLIQSGVHYVIPGRGFLVNRNGGVAWPTAFSAEPRIANSTVNAVAMTVLPDAPIDPATGLRVPTIAVATGGGVSVIKHNGSVVNSSATNAFTTVAVNPSYLMVTNFNDIRSWNSGPVGSLTAGFGMSIWQSGSIDWVRNAGAGLGAFQTKATRNMVMKRTGYSVQLGRMHETDFSKSLFNCVTPTFNTGWMTGDIRRAYLSDVTAESISGSELVTNGTFATDISGWTQAQGLIEWDAGTLSCRGDTNTNSTAQQIVSVTAGKTYLATWSQDAVSQVFFGSSSMNANLYFGGSAASGTSSALFTATTPQAFLHFRGTGNRVRFDNISVREVVADRSYKAQSAAINGTLTKSQLASGTSLVGYSGFSASNYLREPYSADLDFGTGEWNASAWVNIPTSLTGYPTTGSELISNGSFNANISGWTGEGGGESTWDSGNGGRLKITNITGGFVYAYTSIATVVGKKYLFSVESSNAPTYHYVSTDAPGGGGLLQWFSADGMTPRVFTATTTTTYIRVGVNQTNTGFTAYFDNISVKEIVDPIIAERAHSSGPAIKLSLVTVSPASVRLAATAFDGTTTRTVTTTAAYNTATWLKADANYTTDGSLTIRVNGREVAATRGNPLLTLNNTSAVLTIGNSFAADAPFPGTIALLKLGATVPTPEQATFMYEQEKQLFRANAQSVLPDTGSIVDMAYDDATDRWVAVSAANESYWTGLIRNTVTPVPAGSYTKIVATSGIELAARSTTNPGVDVTIPAYGLREELVKRAEAAARLGKELAIYDYVGGFTGNTTSGSTAIASVSTITYPGSYIGARISGSGIPANATIVAVSGTTLYISAAATATATGVSITFLDFELPVGMEAKTVFSAGVQQREGATAAFTRLYDGFIETIRFGTAPGATALVTIQAQRITLQ